MEWVHAKQLGDLFPIFDRLEKGAAIALETFGTREAAVASGYRVPGAGAHLGVSSSGSTGQPKLVWCPWPALKAEVRHGDSLRGWTWASPFLPCTFAGVQVALQAWGCGGKILSLNTGWPACWRMLQVNHVDGLSCTPTFIDLLLQEEPNPTRGWQPRQITLGGEVLRPKLGQRLAERFPQTHFPVVYASAEFGVLLKTHRLDGWYEPQALNKRYGKWRVKKDRLEVWRNECWQGTGDLVEAKEDLIREVGRADAEANEAGTKVSLAEVSRLAEEVPGVRRAVAAAEPNQITGQIVCLRFCAEPGTDPKEAQQRLEIHLQQHLRKEAWPRRWEVDGVEPGQNAKRRAG